MVVDTIGPDLAVWGEMIIFVAHLALYMMLVILTGTYVGAIEMEWERSTGRPVP